MDDLINNIVSYLKYLNKDCKLNVSVHFKSGIFERMTESMALSLLPYNSHTNSYCVMAKSRDYDKCQLNQKKILAKCEKNIPFCNVCHAEVREYIYPFYRNSDSVGFVAVSGYRADNPNLNNILSREIWENALDGRAKPELCDAVIPPLCIMMECALKKYLKAEANEYNQILQFLNEYHTDITLSDLAKYFSRSNSYISHLFRKNSGMTLRAYCNRLKLNDAKKLLLTTEIPVTEVAINTGFNDTSYFIRLFKEEFGITPLQYRYTTRF